MTKIMLSLLPLVVAVTRFGSPVSPPGTARTDLDVDRIIELGHSFQAGGCFYACGACAPPLLGHEMEYVGLGGGYESSHEEPCNDFGTCGDHWCEPEAPNPEDVQGLLDGVEQTTDEELTTIVRELPTLFALDETRRALLVRSCRPGTFIGRFPVSDKAFTELARLPLESLE